MKLKNNIVECESLSIRGDDLFSLVDCRVSPWAMFLTTGHLDHRWSLCRQCPRWIFGMALQWSSPSRFRDRCRFCCRARRGLCTRRRGLLRQRLRRVFFQIRVWRSKCKCNRVGGWWRRTAWFLSISSLAGFSWDFSGKTWKCCTRHHEEMFRFAYRLDSLNQINCHDKASCVDQKDQQSDPNKGYNRKCQ